VNRAEEGLGIGLSLVKNVVAQHGGSVEAYSAGPGEGSTFVVRLPLYAERAPGAIPGEPRPALAATVARRVLVADDNPDSAASLAMLLNVSGHETQVAYDGQTAIERTRSFQPEVVFLDLGMPGIDGLEAARRIRALPGGDDIVLIALTGWGQARDRERTRLAGFDRHLVKPVALATLLDVAGASRLSSGLSDDAVADRCLE
jgi:CheY-like chemotaxis protein